MKIKELIPLYLKHLKVLGRSPRTIIGAKYDLSIFVRFLDEMQVYTLESLSDDVLEAYQEDLAFRLTAKGSLLTLRSQAQRLSVVRGFTRYLKQEDYLIHDPGQRIKLPKTPRRLPKVVLSAAEIKKLLNAPDMRTNRGYRNRVILEILYDTAIRRTEACNIRLIDVDLASGYIRIMGKGSKERVVPVSSRVCEMIQNYLLAVRPSFVQGKDTSFLILNRWGNQMHPNAIWAVVKRCTDLAGIKKRVSPHTLRHTCATHMLKNGAPVRHIQEFLGHESLESTQVYTHVTINDLKAIHAKYHPSETMK